MKEEIKRWMSSRLLPLDYKKALENASKEELFECFGAKLGFGTGGMRGLMGVGPNRINDFTIKGASIGLAYFLLEKFAQPISVIIAYDTRRDGKRFAKVAAQTLAHFNIKSFVFKSPRPTPQLSYVIRNKGAQAGIIITASHNPSEYNGYKLYDENGCQFVPDLAEKVAHFMDTKEDYFAFELEDYQTLLKKSIIKELDEKEDENYLLFLKSLHPLVKNNPNFKVVYTPIHGTGYVYGAKILQDLGFNILEVEEQKIPDSSFSTVKSPNPESKEAFRLAKKIGLNNKAFLLLATDPDGDRLGVAVLDNDNYIYLDGSTLGALLLNYLIKVKPPRNGAVMITTIVTPELGSLIAKKHGIKVLNTLTGFKFIGEQIELLRKNEYFYFGYEESFGYLFSSKVRDKDAFQALIMTTNMFHYHFNSGKSIIKIMDEMYKEYGYFNDELLNYEFEGIRGKAKISKIMQNVRNNIKELFEGLDIECVEDYLSSQKITKNADIVKLTLPISDVFRIIFDFGSVTFRPSGTEPKMKIYLSIHDVNKDVSYSRFVEIKKRITNFMEQYYE